jgi:hypothetical protein
LGRRECAGRYDNIVLVIKKEKGGRMEMITIAATAGCTALQSFIIFWRVASARYVGQASGAESMQS